MSTSRSTLIGKLFKVLKKHFRPVTPPQERPVLEHLLYGCLLENARYEAADEAFAKLKELYFDWNEVRVTTITELAEGMTGIPDATAAAQRVKKALQSIFEATYSFDLEGLKKLNLGKAEKELERINGTTPFGRAYVVQNALGGHSIPVSPGALDALYAVGIITQSEAEKGVVPGLERAIPKNKGSEFASLLQQWAAELVAAPGSPKLKAIFAEMEQPQYKERLAARQAHREALAAAEVAAARQAREKAREEARAEARAVAETKSAARGGKSAAKGAAAKPGEKAPEPHPEKPDKEKPEKGVTEAAASPGGAEPPKSRSKPAETKPQVPSPPATSPSAGKPAEVKAPAAERSDKSEKSEKSDRKEEASTKDKPAARSGKGLVRKKPR
jgi:endonuclease III